LPNAIDAYTVKVVKSPLALLGQQEGGIMVLVGARIHIISKHVSEVVKDVTPISVSPLDPLAYISQS
jgi:hypothetical protein